MATSDEAFRARIPEYADGELNERDSLDLERHLEQCHDCRELLEDLRQIDRLAGTLPTREPDSELWNRISQELGAPPARSSHYWRDYRVWASVAAMLLMLLGVTVVFQQESWSTRTSEELVDQVADELVQAETHYQSAIEGLEKIFEDNQTSLDPELTATLQQNLEVIEAAVEESRQALASHPESPIARESLLDGLRLKVSLLQNVILMMNEVRKGDGEGALEFIDKIRTDEPASSI